MATELQRCGGQRSFTGRYWLNHMQSLKPEDLRRSMFGRSVGGLISARRYLKRATRACTVLGWRVTCPGGGLFDGPLDSPEQKVMAAQTAESHIGLALALAVICFLFLLFLLPSPSRSLPFRSFFFATCINGHYQLCFSCPEKRRGSQRRQHPCLPSANWLHRRWNASCQSAPNFSQGADGLLCDPRCLDCR